MSNEMDAGELHLAHVQKHGLPTVQRAAELKMKLEANVLSAKTVGGTSPDALDTLSIVNEWLMIHTDRRYFEAFTNVTITKVQEETT